MQLKRKEILKIIEKSESDSKAAWKIVNSEIGRNKTDTAIPDLQHNNKLISDPSEKLNVLAEFYSQNPENIKTSIPVANNFYDHLCRDDCAHLDSIKVTLNEVVRK